MSAFIQVTLVIRQETGLLERPIRIHADAIGIIERQTLELEGNRTMAVTHLYGCRNGMAVDLHVKESPDVIESAIERALARPPQAMAITMPDPERIAALINAATAKKGT